MQCLIAIDNIKSKSRLDFKFEVLNLTIRDPEHLLLYICIYLTGFPFFLNFHYCQWSLDKDLKTHFEVDSTNKEQYVASEIFKKNNNNYKKFYLPQLH